MKEERYLNFLRWCLEVSYKGDYEVVPFVEDIDWHDLLTFAQKQTVVGLYWQGLQRLPADGPNKPSEDDVMDWMGEYTKIARRNTKTNKTLSQMGHFLDRNGISYFVFKGQTVGSYYPVPGARTSGDIDFYVFQKDRQKAVEFLQQKGVKMMDNHSGQHWEFSIDGIPFELHYHTAVFSQKKNQRYWDDLIETYFDDVLDHIDINGTSIPTLPPTVNAIYLFIHIYHHFLKEGIALRQFVDWMMEIYPLAPSSERREERIDATELKEKLDKLGLTRAFKAFGAVLVDVLGLDEKHFPLPLTGADRKYEKDIMEIVLRYGNFGKYGRNEQSAGWAHSMETGLRSLRHAFKFFWLSPGENILWFPQLIRRSLKKNWRSTPALLKKEGEVQSES